MTHHAHCQCQQIKLELTGKPIIKAYCHCVDCRAISGAPFHPVTAWPAEQVSVNDAGGLLQEFKDPNTSMSRFFCRECGNTVFNTNIMGWRVVSQTLIRQSNDGELAEPLRSTRHFYYEQRVVDVDDDLPKHLRGTDGGLYQG